MIQEAISKLAEKEDLTESETLNAITFIMEGKATTPQIKEFLLGLKSKGETIEDFDCAIAAILLSNGVNKIITRNKKHFERIKGLTVLKY